MPSFGGWMFLLDICCQLLENICNFEGFCGPFGPRVGENMQFWGFLLGESTYFIGFMLPTFGIICKLGGFCGPFGPRVGKFAFFDIILLKLKNLPSTSSALNGACPQRPIGDCPSMSFLSGICLLNYMYKQKSQMQISWFGHQAIDWGCQWWRWWGWPLMAEWSRKVSGAGESSCTTVDPQSEAPESSTLSSPYDRWTLLHVGLDYGRTRYTIPVKNCDLL